MHFGYIEELLQDPKGTLLFLLLALPGRLLAISMHEAAHAWVADRCGDPTARMMGRVTLNPLKHLDPVGVLMMLVLGLGWARPVPINPRNYRNDRRDDLLVSIAGIAMNLILFVLGFFLAYAVLAIAIGSVPYYAQYAQGTGDLFRTTYQGTPVLMEGQYYYDLGEVFRYGIYAQDVLVAPVLGNVAGYLFQMLRYFVQTNLVLAIFNLIPVPPLDGYHVLNDLFIRRPLFATPRSQQIGMGILYLGAFTGVLSDVLGTVYQWIVGGAGGLMTLLVRALGLF